MAGVAEPITTPVRGCARCGLDHDEVEMQPLTQPMEIAAVRLTHWAPCPTNGEPILLRVVEAPG